MVDDFQLPRMPRVPIQDEALCLSSYLSDGQAQTDQLPLHFAPGIPGKGNGQ